MLAAVVGGSWAAFPSHAALGVADEELWVSDGKLHASLGGRELLPVLERLQALTGIRFQMYGGVGEQVVFGFFPGGLAVEEGVLRLLGSTSHAVVRDEHGRIAWIAVLGPAGSPAAQTDEATSAAAAEELAAAPYEDQRPEDAVVALDVFEDRLEDPISMPGNALAEHGDPGVEPSYPPVAGCEDGGCEHTYVSREDPEGWRWTPQWMEPRIPGGAAN